MFRGSFSYISEDGSDEDSEGREAFATPHTPSQQPLHIPRQEKNFMKSPASVSIEKSLLATSGEASTAAFASVPDSPLLGRRARKVVFQDDSTAPTESSPSQMSLMKPSNGSLSSDIFGVLEPKAEERQSTEKRKSRASVYDVGKRPVRESAILISATAQGIRGVETPAVASQAHRQSTAGSARHNSVFCGKKNSTVSLSGSDDNDVPTDLSKYNKKRRGGARGAVVNEDDEKLQRVRERAMELRLQQIQEKEQQYAEAEQRRQEALERKAFMEEHPSLERAASWQTLISLTAFTHACMRSIDMKRDGKQLRSFFFPRVAIRMRRALRRARCKLYGKDLPRPTIQSLRFDKMLNLFSDLHLRHYVESLEQRYYFLNETIIFMGSEDDEAYVLASGSADVMMGANKVFTLKAGMSFGTVGMISGEPRTASIVAREPCIVWFINRKTFESYGTRDNQVQAALAIIAELRQTNMLNVYKSIVDPSFLASFAVFADVNHEVLSTLVHSRSVPRVVKPGEALIAPSMTLARCPHLLLLRGTIKISLHKGACKRAQSYSLQEYLRHLFDVPRKLRRGGGGFLTLEEQGVPHHLAQFAGTSFEEYFSAAALSAAVNETNTFLTTGSDNDVNSFRSISMPSGSLPVPDDSITVELMRATAPLLINIAPLFLQYSQPTPFVVESVGDCDLLGFARDVIRQQDPLELATIRQNCLNLRTEFMPSITRMDLLQMLLKHSKHMPGVAAALLSLKFSCAQESSDLPQKKFIYAAQDFVHFDPQYEMSLIVVTSGELDLPPPPPDAPPVELPFLWPDLPHLYFAGSSMSVRAKGRVEAIRVTRAELIHWFGSDMKEGELNQFVLALGTELWLRSGKIPAFSEFGLESELSLNSTQSFVKNPLQRNQSATRFKSSANLKIAAAFARRVSNAKLLTPGSTPAMIAVQTANDVALRKLRERKAAQESNSYSQRDVPSTMDGSPLQPSSPRRRPDSAKAKVDGGKNAPPLVSSTIGRGSGAVKWHAPSRPSSSRPVFEPKGDAPPKPSQPKAPTNLRVIIANGSSDDEIERYPGMRSARPPLTPTPIGSSNGAAIRSQALHHTTSGRRRSRTPDDQCDDTSSNIPMTAERFRNLMSNMRRSTDYGDTGCRSSTNPGPSASVGSSQRYLPVEHRVQRVSPAPKKEPEQPSNSNNSALHSARNPSRGPTAPTDSYVGSSPRNNPRPSTTSVINANVISVDVAKRRMISQRISERFQRVAESMCVDETDC